MPWLKSVLFELRSRRVITADLNDLASFGFDKPQSILTLSDNILSEQLLIGNPFPNEALNKTYAQIKGKPQVITVNTSFVAFLPNSIAEWQEKPAIGPIRK